MKDNLCFQIFRIAVVSGKKSTRRNEGGETCKLRIGVKSHQRDSVRYCSHRPVSGPKSFSLLPGRQRRGYSSRYGVASTLCHVVRGPRPNRPSPIMTRNGVCLYTAIECSSNS